MSTVEKKVRCDIHNVIHRKECPAGTCKDCMIHYDDLRRHTCAIAMMKDALAKPQEFVENHIQECFAKTCDSCAKPTPIGLKEFRGYNICSLCVKLCDPFVESVQNFLRPIMQVCYNCEDRKAVCFAPKRLKLKKEVLNLTGFARSLPAIDLIHEVAETYNFYCAECLCERCSKFTSFVCSMCDQNDIFFKLFDDKKFCYACYDKFSVNMRVNKSIVQIFMEKQCEICHDDLFVDNEFVGNSDHVNVFEKSFTISDLIYHKSCIDVVALKKECEKCRSICVHCHSIITRFQQKCGLLRYKTLRENVHISSKQTLENDCVEMCTSLVKQLVKKYNKKTS